MLVLWEESEEPFVNVAIWHNGEYRHRREMAGAFGDFVRSEQYAAAAFLTDDATSRFVVLASGPVRLKTAIVADDLVRTFQIRSVATAPFVATRCNGRVFVLDRRSWSDFQLLLTTILASRIGIELDRQLLQIQAEEASAVSEPHSAHPRSARQDPAEPDGGDLQPQAVDRGWQDCRPVPA